MTIPTSSNFPDSFDDDTNLYLVHDSLRVQLTEDYIPGATSIQISGDEQVISRFPPTGIITLTEQCSDIENRAISFFYNSRTATTFDGLEKLPGFNDTVKPKRLTNITMNVVAPQHNNLKDALIAIEEFVGTKGTIDNEPLGATIEGRTNFLRKLALSPRAWFSARNTTGLVPLEVLFHEECFRKGDGDVTYTWSFGDQDNISTISTISTTDVVPESDINVLVEDIDGGNITKTYTSPGDYDVILTVRNEHGEDTVEFKGLVNARIQAPDEAVIDFIPRSNQTLVPGSPSGGPYVTPPVIRSSTNTFIDFEIQSGENSATPGVSYGGEPLDMLGSPIDPITEYIWALSDDLIHNNSSTTRASYSIGGLYDLKLRVNTDFGAYRITTYEDAIDIIENQNLWLWTYGSMSSVNSYEYGLISETFKTHTTTQTVTPDDSFLDGTENEVQAKQEFARNVAFAPRGTTPSGGHGSAMLYWASGGGSGGSLLDHEINIAEYEGFGDSYLTHPSIAARPWNWAALSSSSKTYFVFGQDPTIAPSTNPSYQYKTTFDLSTLSDSTVAINSTDYSNGADELTQHTSSYESGIPTNGYFAVYRTAWKDQTGFILRNDGVGEFFRIKSFYRTEGVLSNAFQSIRKLTDMAGNAKFEGQLVPMSNGVFFFNNSGSISAYNDNTGIWETGGPSAGSVSFRSVQDSTVSGFDSGENTLMAASDGDRTAYLSYDYSTNAFIKFSGVDLTFTKLTARPSGTQWQLGIY